MTQEDVIRMLREAGFSVEWPSLINKLNVDFERFAYLVAAAEREACAKACESEGQRIDAGWSSCAAAIRARGQE